MRQSLLLPLLLVFMMPTIYAQSSDQTQQGDVSTNSGAVPAMGQEPNPPAASQFPPLSGLDEPSLEPNVAARSFLVYGAQAIEMVDSNASNNLNRKNTALTGATHLLGTAGLQRLWERYQLGLDYVGGGVLYAGRARQNGQTHELNFITRASWRTGSIALRDSARYLPDGTFGGSFGGGLAGGGLGGIGGGGLGSAGGERFSFFGSNSFGAIGVFPRLMNLTSLDLQQSMSPRSAFTLSGGYNIVHFTQSTGGLLIDSHQTSAQAGYNYTINRRNKIALVYGFQHFQFPTASGLSFSTHIVQILYGYQITGRTSLLFGAGPQFTDLASPTSGRTLKLSASARASLQYKFPRTTMTIAYDRFNSAASGFFAGATTDVARLSVSRPLSRRWVGSAHIGYAHNKRLQTAFVGVHAGTYQSGFGSLRLNRIFSRSLHGFLFYEFNELAFDSGLCTSSSPCNRITNRNVAGIGISWHPHPIRLD